MDRGREGEGGERRERRGGWRVEGEGEGGERRKRRGGWREEEEKGRVEGGGKGWREEGVKSRGG